MIDSLDHIIIAVRDLDDTETTYTRILGRTPSWRGEHPGLGSANLIYRLANTYLEFVSATGDGVFADMIRTQLEEKGEGLMGLALGTKDAKGCASALKEAGIGASDPMPGDASDANGNKRSWLNVMIPPEDAGGLFMFAIEQDDRLAIPLSPRADGVAGAAAIDAVDHVVINTPDADAFIDLFEGKLGLRLALDQTVDKWGVRQLFFRFGAITLEVISPIGEDRKPKENSLWGLAYKCPNIETTQARLTGAGVDVSEVRTGRKPGTLVSTVRPETHGIPTLLIGLERAS